MYRLDRGGAVRPLPGLTDETVICWTADGRGLFVYTYEPSELLARVSRYDVATGRKELWKTLSPTDTAGLTAISVVLISPDGANYVYETSRALSQLFVVTGLK